MFKAIFQTYLQTIKAGKEKFEYLINLDYVDDKLRTIHINIHTKCVFHF